MNTFTRRGRRTSWGALVAIPMLALALAACSPSTDSSPKETTSRSTSTGTASDSSLEKWQRDYAKCMRDQGFDVPDPEPGSGGLMSAMGGEGVDMAAMEAASKTCMDELGEPPAMSPDEQKAADDAMIEWAKKAAECYREHGYDMPDPQPGAKELHFPEDAPDDVRTECGGVGTAGETE